MALSADELRNLTRGSSETAWKAIIERVTALCLQPVSVENAAADITRRDREVGELDHFLSAGGWELWQDFGTAVERTSERLIRWWAEPFSAKSILILDGLSLREIAWLARGAQERGFSVNSATAFASELPSETNAFARAIGFGSRSQLQNNGGGSTHNFAPAKTECLDLPWKDCAGLIDASANWVFWHQWPDSKIHDGSGAGQGLEPLTRDVATQLTSDDFWGFVERLATGRRLAITSDHGYAATGLFFDAPDEQAAFLKSTFKSGRSLSGDHDPGPFVPPVALKTSGPHGPHLLPVGRWKWRSQGGYPTLAHGGLSILEALSPFVELSK